MPRITRRRVISSSPKEVWRLISDPYSLPRWWPRTTRVESVDRKPGDRRSQWTKVLSTAEGRGVRADYHCVSAAEPERYVWEQQLDGTPFGRHLAESRLEIALQPDGTSAGTEVSLTATQKLRGLSRLGSLMMRGAQRKILDEALDGIERALAS